MKNQFLLIFIIFFLISKGHTEYNTIIANNMAEYCGLSYAGDEAIKA